MRKSFDLRENKDAYRSPEITHNGYGQPKGPIGSISENKSFDPAPAIGFCPLCGENSRRTCYNRGVFDCPQCFFVWYDDRVGEKTRSFEDFFSSA